MKRTLVATGGPWEAAFGYSRAVRVGPHVHVSGCTAMTPTGLVGEDDVHAQARQALETIASALEASGARLSDVVRTRMYVARPEDARAVGRAHGEVFGAIRPASTLLVVAALIHPGMLVEIEADAFVAS